MRRSYDHGEVGGMFCGGIVTDPRPPSEPKYCGQAWAEATDKGYADFSVNGCLDRARTVDSAFTFTTTKEADFSLYRNDKRLWTWSATWRTTDAHGRPLPPGDYEVRGTIHAAELGPDNTWFGTLTI